MNPQAPPFVHVPLRLLSLSVLVLFVLSMGQAAPAATAASGTSAFTGSASVLERVTFAPSGSMSVARSTHTATLLLNGKVLVAGGYDRTLSSLATAELYDSTSGTWNNTGSMATARSFHSVTLLPNGEVLVVGGGGHPELYDPVTGTWATTGSLATARASYTATLLPNGKVLVAGGWDAGSPLASAELYDPASGTWSSTGSMASARASYTATLLPNGKVLVSGGYDRPLSSLATAELYDSTSGTWNSTGSMASARRFHTATLLPNGKVLVAGGESNDVTLASADLYDPASGTWSSTGSLSVARQYHTATLLPNGKVLVARGGSYSNGSLPSTELYDPTNGTWSGTDSMATNGSYHTATLLPNGKVLIAGGSYSNGALTELGTLHPANTFTATLTLPSGWRNSTAIDAQFVGTASAAAIEAGALSNDATTWGAWVTAGSGVAASTTWDVGGEGANKPVSLRLRDVNSQITTVVTGTVNVDLTPPSSTMTALPATSPTAITLAWSGTDALSGVATYDLQVRAGSGTWTDVFTHTPATSTIYNGEVGVTYAFRVRAFDTAGNVEAWLADADTATLVDTDAPTGTLIINGGALATTSPQVALSLAAQDVSGTVAQMRFANDGTWDAWQPYAGTAGWSLTAGDELKTVFVQFKDVAGNVTPPITQTITLDSAVGTAYGMTINTGALFTNQVTVTLTTSAPALTPQMMVSNDGGFAGATWEPYTTRRAWQITQYGSSILPRVAYVRYKDANGTIIGPYQDDIILDVTAPTGSVAFVAVGITSRGNATPGATVQTNARLSANTFAYTVYLPFTVSNLACPATGATNSTLRLTAQDDVSGVAAMLISSTASFVCAQWEPFAQTKPWHNSTTEASTVYVRFRDSAGNVSQVYTAVHTP